MARTVNRSARLAETCAPTMREALGARFIREVSAGSIGDQPYANYLEIEESFVESACRLHGIAVGHAPSWAAIRRHARSLHGLTTEQTEYFRSARAAWTVSSRMDATASAQAAELAEFALSAARTGGHAAVVTVLFAAEHLYRTWCSRVANAPAGPVAEWVALHARDPFTSQVEALAAEVDELPDTVSDQQLDEWFTGMLRAEIRFHDAVYLS